jgi:hypothetical protein
MTTFMTPTSGKNSKTSLQSKEKDKRKQKPTANVGRGKGGDRSQKRNGH